MYGVQLKEGRRVESKNKHPPSLTYLTLPLRYTDWEATGEAYSLQRTRQSSTKVSWPGQDGTYRTYLGKVPNVGLGTAEQKPANASGWHTQFQVCGKSLEGCAMMHQSRLRARRGN